MIPELENHHWAPSDYTATATLVANEAGLLFTASEQVVFAYPSLLDKIMFDVVNTDGTGTNTYTIERTLDGGVSWQDVTNEWFAVASFTASFSKSPAFPVPVDDVRIRLVRIGDPAPGDGAYTVIIRRRRWS